MSLHDGHRQRMKTRFLEHGLDNFDDVNALELLLFFAQPRQDTNIVAHALLERFGSFSAVMEAGESELRSVPGVGENSALLLHLIPAVSQRYLISKTPEEQPVRTPADAARFFIPRFMYEREEVALALLLDARCRPIVCRELSRGVVNAVEINARKLVELGMERRCSGVVLAHNHLSGMALPSREDESSTRRLQQALALVDIELRDHIVVAGVEYVSMKESGMLR